MEMGTDLSGETEHAAPRDGPAKLGVGLLFRFLIGQRGAIETAARQGRRLVWIALLLVVSAGLAREYDGEDLLARPWFVLAPLAVSLPMALTLWTVVYGVAALGNIRGLKYG